MENRFNNLLRRYRVYSTRKHLWSEEHVELTKLLIKEVDRLRVLVKEDTKTSNHRHVDQGMAGGLG